MSKAGTPRNNAVMESFFGRFKDVIFSHFDYKHCDDIKKVISDTVYYFNYIKPLTKLNKKPPVHYMYHLY